MWAFFPLIQQKQQQRITHILSMRQGTQFERVRVRIRSAIDRQLVMCLLLIDYQFVWFVKFIDLFHANGSPHFDSALMPVKHDEFNMRFTGEGGELTEGEQITHKKQANENNLNGRNGDGCGGGSTNVNGGVVKVKHPNNFAPCLCVSCPLNEVKLILVALFINCVSFFHRGIQHLYQRRHY